MQNGNPDSSNCDEIIKSHSTAAKVWAALHHGGLSARTFNRLLAEFGTVDELLASEASLLQEGFEFSEEQANRLSIAYESLTESEQFIKTLAIRNVEYITVFDNEYPLGFRELNDPPPIFFYRGTLLGNGAKCVALVGSSAATQDGISVAVDFGSRAADADVTLISGLSKGIDSSGLVGAITAEGKTCAVALSGLENLHPEDCAPVFEQVIQSGCTISEYSPEREFSSQHTSEANRLVAALAQAVVIGEVTDNSPGTLDVAQSCVESGKLLFVLVPTDTLIHSEKALEPFVELGAVPVKFPEDMDTILRCLV